MNELITIEQELKAIQEEGNKKVLEYKEEIQTAKDNEEEANREVLKAKRGNDSKIYAKAIADKRTASDIAKFYEGKIEEINNEPYITAAEYKEFTSRINNAMDNINQQASKRASELLDELKTVQEEVTPAFNKANELLKALQNDIYKRSYERQMQEAKQGKAINSQELRNEYKNNSVITGIEFILNTVQAQNIKDGGGK